MKERTTLLQEFTIFKLLKENNWIQKAVSKNPGKLHKKAESVGEVNPDGTIKKEWINKKAKGNDTTAKEARLAKTLSELRKK